MPNFAQLVIVLVVLSGMLPANAGDTLLVCGGAEVFEVDPAALGRGEVEKRWSWRAGEQRGIPAEIARTFATTDECKPVRQGRQVLITSSGGGCALVDYPSGQVRWQARVTNAHSIELLPGNRVVVAGSVGNGGNCLQLFDLSGSGEPIGSTPLTSAHGVVWDATREVLWALGFDELRLYRLQDWESASPSLTLEQKFPLPDEGGHDLQSIPGSHDLVITTHGSAFLFDRSQQSFRPHPELRDQAHIKGITIHPETRQTFFVQANETQWWSDTIRSTTAPQSLPLPGEKLYKVRWLVKAQQ